MPSQFTAQVLCLPKFAVMVSTFFSDEPRDCKNAFYPVKTQTNVMRNHHTDQVNHRFFTNGMWPFKIVWT